MKADNLVTGDFMRLNVGHENIDDIIEDVDRALNA
ncbi:MAG: hypothetical protein GX568_09120 [Candidatus Gastranaerophilales bacterium]|nr:hypothetical protein [Candidatus Gastranaerophilales bacterium]